MGTFGQPEVGVKITATTSGLTTGFADAVRQTEKGVAQINAAMSRLEQSQVLAEQWTRRRAAAEREAYAVSATMAAAQGRVATALSGVSAAAEISAARYAQTASKGLMLVDVLSRTATVSGGTAAKLLSFGTAASSVFGVGGIAFAAVVAFGALFVTEMQKARTEMEETRKKWRETIAELVNAGDVERMKKRLQDLELGTPANQFRDGIRYMTQDLAAFKENLAQVNPISAWAGTLRDAIAGKEEKLRALREEAEALQRAILDAQNVPRTFGTAPITITAKRPGERDPAAERAAREAARDREQLAQAEYQYQQTLAAQDFAKKRALAEAWLDEQSAIYGTNSAEYVNALRELEQMDREHNAAVEAEDRRHRDAVFEAEQERKDIQAQTINEYQQGWERALERVSSMFESAFSGIFNRTKSLGDAFRDLGRTFLMSMAQNIAKSVQIFIAAEITKRVWGAATAKQTVANSAVEAASKAWAATVGIPVVGPFLAPGAAALAFAGVLAFGSSIKSAAGGWGQVPEDQVAMVHKNEMILPASIADSVRKMSEGGAGSVGGGSVSFHVTALDAASFDAYLRRHGAALSDALMQLVRSGQLPLRTA